MLLHLILFAKQKDFDVMCQKLSQAYQRKNKFSTRYSRSPQYVRKTGKLYSSILVLWLNNVRTSFLLWLVWRILALFGGEIEGAACVFLRWNGSSITEGFHAVLRLQWKTWWNMETDNKNQHRFCILYTEHFSYKRRKKNKYNRS